MEQSLHLKTKHLNNERYEILGKIVDRSLGVDGGPNTSLEHLKARYNILMDRIDTIDKSPLGDPLRALPLELWEKIIYDAIRIDGLFGFSPSDIDVLLPLTLVSKYWRQSILTTPGFWVQIQISERTGDLEAKLATCIQLSRSFPLDIYVDLRGPLSDAIGLPIAAQSSRIRTLAVTTSNWPLQSTVPILTNFFKSLGRLSALEALSIYGPQIDADCLLKDVTCIRSVHGVDLSPQTLQLDSMQNLREIYVYQSHYDILPHIRSFRHLKTVGFLNPMTTLENLEGEFSDFDKIKYASNLNQEPWQLETLEIAMHPGKPILSLLDIVSTTLDNLTINIPWDLLSSLLIACSHMPRLTNLWIRLPISASAGFQSHSFDHQKSNIRVFTLVIEGPSILYGQVDEAVNTASQRAAQGFADALTVWAPNVRDIWLQTPINPSFALSYIQSLEYLRILQLSMSNTVLKVSPEIRLNGIESLFLRAHNHTPDLSALSCPNALKLSIDSSGVAECSLVLRPLGTYADRWFNLRTIDITVDSVLWESIFLPYVESITIGSQYASKPHIRHLSPSLLKEMACNSSSFPSLAHLGLRSFPDWDVLFIMLERRNLSTSTEVKPVKRLSFPSFPAPVVLQPLSELLRRRMTDRASNFDVSLQSLAEAYFDRELGGCGDCHMSFVSCTGSPSYFHYPPDIDDKNDIPKLQVPPYPSTDNEVLSTCLQRASWWEDTVRKLGDRHSLCARHDTYKLVEVTGYTCFGLFEVLAPVVSPLR